MIQRHNFWNTTMGSPYATTADELARAHTLSHGLPQSVPHASHDGAHALVPSQSSAVSWGAILAGAAAAAALSLILLVLGVGLGLSSVSPWAQSGASAATFGISTILWVTFTQLVASAMGGYLAGRLRTKWAAVHSDEVYFRDTAHGFLAWAVASLATAALLTSVIGSIVGGGVQAGASVVGGVASTAVAAGVGASAAGDSGSAKTVGATGPMAYFIDSLFRKDMAAAAPSVADASPATSTAEVARILMNTVRAGSLPVADVRYVGQLVAQRTGLSQMDAEKRVSDTYARMQANLNEAQASAKDAADKARKASAYGALWLFISLLAGAFIASLGATWGGRMRDA
jgi:hypothetical protein